MKLDNKILKEMIREVLSEQPTTAATAGTTAAASVDPKKFGQIKTGVMSTSQRIKKSRERIKSAGAELTASEQKIIEQIEQKLTELASLPEVDLVKQRPLLSRILKLLNQQIAPKK
jgi:succinyl-CoA synthetase alpha subunit